MMKRPPSHVARGLAQLMRMGWFGAEVLKEIEPRVTRAAVIFNPETASIATSGVPPVTAVPEPSTWAMLLIGFAGLGFAGQPRRKAPFA
jgi:NaMN:DMB phosphoribosyltransferase